MAREGKKQSPTCFLFATPISRCSLFEDNALGNEQHSLAPRVVICTGNAPVLDDFVDSSVTPQTLSEDILIIVLGIRTHCLALREFRHIKYLSNSLSLLVGFNSVLDSNHSLSSAINLLTIPLPRRVLNYLVGSEGIEPNCRHPAYYGK